MVAVLTRVDFWEHLIGLRNLRIKSTLASWFALQFRSKRAEADNSDADYSAHLSGDKFILSRAPSMTPAETASTLHAFRRLSPVKTNLPRPLQGESQNKLKRLGVHLGEPADVRQRRTRGKRTGSTGWQPAPIFRFVRKSEEDIVAHTDQ